MSGRAAIPTTPLARLRETAEAALAAAEQFGAGWYDAPDLVAALDAMVGSPDSEADAAHIVAFDPATVLALLDVVEAATAFVKGGRSFIGGPLRAAVDRLDEVTS